ncbi:MAG: 50S ribosomal protein L21 [Candidatus Niyogibacteria bacterium]|nr:50S ribosomal protein L21 [Candidatus Niyogibacteria bacterium]
MVTVKKSKTAAKSDAFAVIETGGKQYLVSAGTKVKVEKLAGEAGDKIDFDRVLLIGDDSGADVGRPIAKGAVSGRIVGQGRYPKVTTIKYRPKARHHRKVGHKQPFTEIEIVEINK